MTGEDLIDALTFRIRHIAPVQFPDSARIRSLCRRLTKSGVLQCAEVCIAPVHAVELVCAYENPKQQVNWDSLAKELLARWEAMKSRPTELCYATPRTIDRLGGAMPGRLGQLDALTHDSGVAATYFALIRADPLLKLAWVPEERIPEAYGTVHPDALLADSSGPKAIVEFCGTYTAKRLHRLARFADFQELPLQLWTVSRKERL